MSQHPDLQARQIPDRFCSYVASYRSRRRLWLVNLNRLPPRRYEVCIHPCRSANMNIPLPFGTGDKGYDYAMQELVEPVVKRFAPKLIVVPLGLDGSAVSFTARLTAPPFFVAVCIVFRVLLRSCTAPKRRTLGANLVRSFLGSCT